MVDFKRLGSNFFTAVTKNPFIRKFYTEKYFIWTLFLFDLLSVFQKVW